MNICGIEEVSELGSDWLNLYYLVMKIFGEDRFVFRRGKEITGACVDLSFRTTHIIKILNLFNSATCFGHNRVRIVVHEESEKEELFPPDDGRNKGRKNVIELNKINIKDAGI